MLVQKKKDVITAKQNKEAGNNGWEKIELFGARCQNMML